jgi:hypothetical protein
MKIRYLLLIALIFVGFSTGSHASKKDLDPSFSFEKNDRFDEKHFNDDEHGHHGHGDKGGHHIVAFDFDDELRNLADRHHEKHNVYLSMNKNEEEHEHHGNVDTGASPPINEVPLPAALWLFGSGLLGLLGVARKPA